MSSGPKNEGSVYDGWVDGPSMNVDSVIIILKKVDSKWTPRFMKKSLSTVGEYQARVLSNGGYFEGLLHPPSV